MARPKSNSSAASRVERRARKAPPDTVFYAGQFLDIDTRAAADKALSRLVRAGVLRRLARGLYYRPRRHPMFGDIAPSVKSIADALAKRDHVRLQPTGAYAAHDGGRRANNRTTDCGITLHRPGQCFPRAGGAFARTALPKRSPPIDEGHRACAGLDAPLFPSYRQGE